MDLVDNLECVFSVLGEEKILMFEGVELMLKLLLIVLEKFGVVVVDIVNGFNVDLY